MNITNENFYGGFALEDPNSYDPFIDETIYYPKAYFKIAKRDGENWDWKIKDIELERCHIDKFGSFYQDKFKSKTLNTLYCFKEVNEQFIGHFSYDYYSFFFIEFYPCINTTENNNHCKPLEKIDYYLKSTFISFQLQDIELTPQNYKSPARARDQDIYTTVGKKLFQEIHIYFQIVNIETDLDILGFSEFQQVRSQKYLKYDSTIQMVNLLEQDIYETGISFCNVTIKLSEKILNEKRRYTKLIEVLRDVGGFTEVILSVFQIISYFSSNILYELSLINNLFEFDIDKKLILIRKNQNSIIGNNNNAIYDPVKVYSPKNQNRILNQKAIIINDDNSTHSKNKLILENLITKNKLNNERYTTRIKKRKKNKKLNSLQSYNIDNSDNKEGIISSINLKKENKNGKSKKKKENVDENIIKNYPNLENNKEIDEEKNYIISKIKINFIENNIVKTIYINKKRKNVENILLNEGKKIIETKLDIRNIFKKLYKDNDILKDDYNINMSDVCKNNLEELGKIKSRK